MRASANEIIGSLVYRTSVALSKDKSFINEIKKYHFWNALIHDGKLHLWHFPGTQQEISHVFKQLSGGKHGSKLKFPGILNFQGVEVIHAMKQGIDLYRYNLAIIAPVLSSWTTQQREAQVYRLVLKRIEEEFIKQVQRFELFQKPMGEFPYMSVYIPTTGKALNSVMKMNYGDFMDAVEMPNFTVQVISSICAPMGDKIIEESKKVTDEIKNIIQ